MEEEIKQKKQIILELMKDKKYVPMKFKELAVVLNVNKEDKKLLDTVLTELTDEGNIILSKKGKYSIPKEKHVTGLFISNGKGFGFVEVEDEEGDYFIPASKVNGAFHHDMVMITVTNDECVDGKRKEGKVIKILSHEIMEVVGLFQKSKNFGYVVPDNQRITNDIYIAGKDTLGAVDGSKVVAKITNYGSDGRNPEGVITEIIGHVDDPGVDIVSIVKNYEIPIEFPEEVMEQLKSIPDEVPESDKVGRKDIRNWQTVTIDGEDAKDLDDAITLSKKDGLYTLGVHIADVSHYVTENSPLDKAAVERGTSVYLVDRVIPMIPHQLSNGICSLNHDVDRLALSCIMTINSNGDIVDHEIAETLINVNKRMTYTAVKEIIVDENPEVIAQYPEQLELFRLMAELSAILRNKRHSRGSIDFDFPECKIKLDDKGYPVSIEPYDRNVATKLIEDFMLAANETVAEDFYWRQVPFVYRNHDNPDTEKMSQLAMFITNFGYSVKLSKDEVHPKELQKLLEKIEGTPEETLISTVTLRSMKRAEYTPECKGHFGLAAQYYCHFTSPIRRYPDLQIHRIIKECLHNKMTDKHTSHYNEILPEVTAHCCVTERRADDAERDTDKLKKAEYMKGQIGEEFDGVISGVTNFGIYVQLENTVEGLIHVSNMMDDHYIYDEASYSMTGERTKKTYKLGQKVRVRVEAADKLARTIDFSLIEK